MSLGAYDSQVLDLVRTASPQGGGVLALPVVRKHLRYADPDQDDTIQLYATAIENDLDGPSGYLGRCLFEQAWTLYLDRFPRAGRHYRPGHSWRELPLPLPPLIAVDSIGYLDAAGAQHTLDPSAYVVRAGPRASIELLSGQSWPATSLDPRCVQIAFRCGYSANAGGGPKASDLPQGVIAAMLLMVGDLFENREAVVVAESRVTQILNPTADRLLAKHCASWL